MTNGIPNTTMVVNRNLSSTIRNYIKEHGEGKKISEKDVSIILKRMAEVNEARNKDNDPTNNNSIFRGGSQYAGGSGRTNFLVNQGQKIELSNDEYNKIFNGYLDGQPTQQLNIQKLNPVNITDISDKILKSPKKIEIKDNKTDIEKKESAIKQYKNIKNTKVKSREVDGQKQDIIEIKDENGKVKTRLIKADGTLGDELIHKTKGNIFGKATYATKSTVDAQVRTMLGLKDSQNIPDGIKPEFVTDTQGETHLVLKDAKGNKMDSEAIRQFVQNNNKDVNQKTIPTNNPAPAHNSNAAETEDKNAAQENGNSVQEKRNVKGNGVSGNYTITQGKNGQGFSLQEDITVSLINNKQIYNLFFPKNMSSMIQKDAEGNYSFRGIKSKSRNELEQSKISTAQNVAIQQAIYNDLMSKQSSGTYLTDAEQNFIKNYQNDLDRLGIRQDENGNLVDIKNRT